MISDRYEFSENYKQVRGFCRGLPNLADHIRDIAKKVAKKCATYIKQKCRQTIGISGSKERETKG